MFIEHKKELRDAVKKETTGDRRDILLKLLDENVEGKPKVDKDKAEEDAKAFHKVRIFKCVNKREYT